MLMSVVPVSQGCAGAASGQCLLPEDAFPWLFRRAHTCMLSPLSVCSLTFGTVKIEDTAGRKDANGLDGEERLTGWWEACERSERLFKKLESLLQHFSFEGCGSFFCSERKCVFTLLNVTVTTVCSKVSLTGGESRDDVQSGP